MVVGAAVTGILAVVVGGALTGLVLSSAFIAIDRVARRRREALSARDQIGRL